MQGKKIGGSMEAYTRPYETGDLTKAYIQAYPKLRIFGGSNYRIEEQGEEIERLQARIRELETELDKRDSALTRVEESLQQVLERLKLLEDEKTLQ